ncbi:hypothetical protein [Streptomyces kaempferi]|uniref:Uncharacterized protein n=1 Tax=Streptomyces kaempferi TaxID=333725 RepID=A0ABW3XW77_9ACTN
MHDDARHMVRAAKAVAKSLLSRDFTDKALMDAAVTPCHRLASYSTKHWHAQLTGTRRGCEAQALRGGVVQIARRDRHNRAASVISSLRMRSAIGGSHISPGSGELGRSRPRR